MRVDLKAGTLRVFEDDSVVYRIDVRNWSACSDVPRFERRVAAAVAGRATRLRFPPGHVDYRTTADRCDARTEDRASTTSVREPIRIDGAVSAVLAFEGTGIVEEHPDGVDVTFPEARPVRVGVRSSEQGRGRRITVPGTPEGVATALTYASAACDTITPDRSHPNNRRNPPPIRPGSHVHVPDRIRSKRVDTGITIYIPPDLGTAFVLAPLAYYLGARVSVGPRNRPVLRAPDAGIRHELSELPRLQADASSLLYRTVILDCLVRRANDVSGGSPGRLLEAIGVDPERIGNEGIDARLAAYLDAPFRDIEQHLPEWHLSVYATPSRDSVAALEYVLDRLAFVYLPNASRLPEEERLRRSLDDFYREAGDAPTVDPILPDLNRGRLHGWLSDGIAIDAFRLLPEALGNRRSRPAVDDGGMDITLVINDEEMRPEANAVRRIYRERADESGTDLRIEHRLSRDALAAALDHPVDLFHYVGHCDKSGLRCTDGHLDTADLGHSGPRTFFLNACGSYHQGVSLVEAGSVAGAVTLRPVLDEQAKRVGTAFARLLTRGFAVERALRIASRRAIMNKDYAVVGDGAYAVCESQASSCAVLRVSRIDDRFSVRVEHGSADTTATYRDRLLGEGVCLSGRRRSASMSRTELRRLLRGLAVPAVYEDRYYWAPDLRRLLRGED